MNQRNAEELQGMDAHLQEFSNSSFLKLDDLLQEIRAMNMSRRALELQKTW